MYKLIVRLTVIFVVILTAGCNATSATKQPKAAPLKQEHVKPEPQAKNVILFIGDGMGISTVTAIRIYMGQRQGGTGEEYILPFETFPNVALVKTYNTNQQVPDSAGTATAMHTGVKTKAGVIGLGPKALRANCESSKREHLTSIAQRAHNNGKEIGVVTTARLTHATPAAVYAHSPERDWEVDSYIPKSELAKGCKDIAQQLLEFPFSIAMGGGKRNFIANRNGGKRSVSMETQLINWQAKTGGQIISSKNELTHADKSTPILGLFSNSHMTYMAEKKGGSTEPTLTEMTLAAIDKLSKSEGGYYLMIEGGRIDHGHHDGKAGLALSEGEEFANAISAALTKVDLNETLILVTADHSHVFTIAGYPTRGNDILGLVYGNDEQGLPETTPATALDDLPYTTLGYSNGPGAALGKDRSTPDTGIHAIQQALIPTGYTDSNGDKILSETHGGEDVALYAIGAGSERVRGVIEQNQIHAIMLKAFGWSE